MLSSHALRRSFFVANQLSTSLNGLRTVQPLVISARYATAPAKKPAPPAPAAKGKVLAPPVIKKAATPPPPPPTTKKAAPPPPPAAKKAAPPPPPPAAKKAAPHAKAAPAAKRPPPPPPPPPPKGSRNELIAKQKAAEDEKIARANLAAREAKEKEAEKAKEKELKEKKEQKALKEKEKEKEKAAKEKAKVLTQKGKEKEKEQALKLKEKEKALKDKEKEQEQKQKIKQQQEKEKEKAAAAKAKLAEVKKQEMEKKNAFPKRPRSGYMFFGEEARPKVKEDLPKIAFTEVMGEIANRWAALSEEKKLKYQKMADQDKVRFEKDLVVYKKKYPDPPKRGLSAFLHFMQAARPQVVKEFPDASVTEVMVHVANKWKVTPEAEKKKYEALAAKDKEKYTIEKAKFDQEHPST